MSDNKQAQGQKPQGGSQAKPESKESKETSGSKCTPCCG